MLGNRRANDKLNLMEQHQRQNDQADLGRSEQRARYGNPARQTLFRSAKDQNRFVLGGKSSKPGAQCRKHQDDDEQQYVQTRDQGQVKARSEEHTSELQSLMRISYAVFCLKKKKRIIPTITK